MTAPAAANNPAWSLTYGGVNVTGNLVNLAEHVYYSEAISGKASVLEIQLSDVSGAFQNNLPKFGTAVSLGIGYAGSTLISCGDFEIDEWEFTSPPDKFILRAIQAGITRAVRTVKSFAWENQSLVSIASTIAGRYGMTVVADAVQPDVIYARLTQRLESDLAFLHRIANLHNYDFNIRGNTLVFYSRPALDAAAPQKNAQYIYKTDSTRVRIMRQQVGDMVYAAAGMTYFDPLSKALLSALATDPTAESADVLKLVQRMENQQQATLRAQSHLYTSNMEQMKAEITMPGTMLYRAGQTVYLDPATFGPALSQIKFIVAEGKHKLSSKEGYLTTLSLRTTINQGGVQVISDSTFGG